MLVNPRYKTIGKLPVYPDIASLPAAPDLAIIATPAPTVPGLVAALGERGTKAAIVISAGFGASTEGRHRTQSMLDSRSEEHTSELQSLMRISYAVFCLKT